MPAESLVALAFVIAAFVIFTGALAYADYQTQRVTRD